MLPPFWFLFIPLSIQIYGYANARKIRQGENLPKGVAEEWKKWCLNPDYFQSEFDKTLNPVYFERIRIPIKAIQTADDPIANEVTVNKLLQYYKNATLSVGRISPKDLWVSRIGHAGFFPEDSSPAYG